MNKLVVAIGWAVSTISFLVCSANPDPDPAKLKILDNEYPRVFFFRQSEGVAAQKNVSYEDWEKTFERLMGIEGKVLDEEIIGRSIRNIDFFTRFKERHSEQLVLLHFNGNARDPLYESDRFFAGHWLYFNGAKILSDVPAEQGETDIHVENPNLFKVNMGRYRDRNEDIGLCMLDADGKPNWNQSEQVQLISIDRQRKIIRVRRGCYGTEPHEFGAGQGYAAAHMTEGPWGRKNNLLWYYNYSTRCPRDNQGHTCADILVEHLVELFGQNGPPFDCAQGGEPVEPLVAFDGLEFDVLKFRCGGGSKGRGADCDADGRLDAGIHEGINTYGIGVVEFCRQLRERLGQNRFILADGMSETNQRAFGILNGIESEGWPHLRDYQIHDWSGGLNRHFFWDKNVQPPVFNYINHKFNEPTGEPGVVVQADVPFSIHRLVFAVGVFTNSAICYSYPPGNDPDGLFGVWDEFRMGTANRLGWLGKSLGPAMRMAARQPDMLAGYGKPISGDLLTRLAGQGAKFELANGVLKIMAIDPTAAEIRFRLTNVPCSGPDLFVSLTARGETMQGYPPEIARMMYVGAAQEGQEVGKDNRFMTWVGDSDFDSGFYFSNLDCRQTSIESSPVRAPTCATATNKPKVSNGASQIDLEFVVEGSESIWISRIQAYCYPDVMYREFEHGLVLANPSPRPYTFDLDELFPGQTFQRLRGTSTQDVVCNDGSIVRGKLNLGTKEGLFLIRISR